MSCKVIKESEVDVNFDDSLILIEKEYPTVEVEDEVRSNFSKKSEFIKNNVCPLSTKPGYDAVKDLSKKDIQDSFPNLATISNTFPWCYDARFFPPGIFVNLKNIPDYRKINQIKKEPINREINKEGVNKKRTYDYSNQEPPQKPWCQNRNNIYNNNYYGNNLNNFNSNYQNNNNSTYRYNFNGNYQNNFKSQQNNYNANYQTNYYSRDSGSNWKRPSAFSNNNYTNEFHFGNGYHRPFEIGVWSNDEWSQIATNNYNGFHGNNAYGVRNNGKFFRYPLENRNRYNRRRNFRRNNFHRNNRRNNLQNYEINNNGNKDWGKNVNNNGVNHLNKQNNVVEPKKETFHSNPKRVKVEVSV